MTKEAKNEEVVRAIKLLQSEGISVGDDPKKPDILRKWPIVEALVKYVWLALVFVFSAGMAARYYADALVWKKDLEPLQKSVPEMARAVDCLVKKELTPEAERTREKLSLCLMGKNHQ